MIGCKTTRKVKWTALTGLIVSAVVATSGAQASGAAGIVYDPTNHAENLVTAYQTAQQYSLDLQRYYNQFQQLSNPGDLLGDTGLTMQEYQDYMRSVDRLVGDLDGARDFMDDLHRDLSVSQHDDWPAYYESRRERAERRDGLVVSQFERARQIGSRVENQYDVIQRHQNKAAAGFAGEVEGLTQLSTQMAMLQDQNAQLVELASAQQVMSAEEERSASTDAESVRRNARQDAMRSEFERRRSIEESREFYRSIGIEPNF